MWPPEMDDDLRLVIDGYLCARTRLLLGHRAVSDADAALAEAALRDYWDQHPGLVWSDRFEEETYLSVDAVVRELDTRAVEHVEMIRTWHRHREWE